jgi:hypothetical protein
MNEVVNECYEVSPFVQKLLVCDTRTHTHTHTHTCIYSCKDSIGFL